MAMPSTSEWEKIAALFRQVASFVGMSVLGTFAGVTYVAVCVRSSAANGSCFWSALKGHGPTVELDCNDWMALRSCVQPGAVHTHLAESVDADAFAFVGAFSFFGAGTVANICTYLWFGRAEVLLNALPAYMIGVAYMIPWLIGKTTSWYNDEEWKWFAVPKGPFIMLLSSPALIISMLCCNRRHQLHKTWAAVGCALAAAMLTTAGGQAFQYVFYRIRSLELKHTHVVLSGGIISTALSIAQLYVLSRPELQNVPVHGKIAQVLVLGVWMQQLLRDYIAELGEGWAAVAWASLAQCCFEVIRNFVFTTMKLRRWIKAGGAANPEVASYPSVAAFDLLASIFTEYLSLLTSTMRALSLDPLLYSVAKPDRAHTMSNVLFVLLIQLAFEVLADGASIWVCLAIWSRYGTQLPLQDLDLNYWVMKILFLMISFTLFLNVQANLARQECLLCDQLEACFAC